MNIVQRHLRCILDTVVFWLPRQAIRVALDRDFDAVVNRLDDPDDGGEALEPWCSDTFERCSDTFDHTGELCTLWANTARWTRPRRRPANATVTVTLACGCCIEMSPGDPPIRAFECEHGTSIRAVDPPTGQEIYDYEKWLQQGHCPTCGLLPSEPKPVGMFCSGCSPPELEYFTDKV